MSVLRRFRHLIHDTCHSSTLQEYDMVPGELARLCGRRYLSDDHMMWVMNHLNSIQSDTLCVYANFIGDVESFCQNRQAGDTFYLPSRIAVILNVGCTDSGSTYIANGGRSGCHFTITIYNDITETIMYGDSLGWKIPGGLLQLMNRYIRSLYGKECNNITETHDGVHSCHKDCLFYYPLQKDGDICGIIVLLIASIVSLSPEV